MSLSRRLSLLGWLTVSTSLLTGCSTVPDYANPVEWYKNTLDLFSGEPSPDVGSPSAPKGERPDPNKTPDMRKDIAKGLPSDRNNARYAEPVRREAAPTKALAKAAPVVESAPPAAVAAAPAPAPASPAAVAGSAAARLSPDQRTQTARMEPTLVPPAALNAQPPAPAGLPLTVSGSQPRQKPVLEQYQRRLAESSQQQVPGMLPVSAYGRGDDEPIHLVPPPSMRGGTHKGGGRGMAAPQPSSYSLQSSTFQVGAVDFQSGGTRLSGADRSALAEVARVYKKSGGVVRILGLSPDDDESFERANAVAAELVRKGVPARKIMVAGDVGDGGALIYLDL